MDNLKKAFTSKKFYAMVIGIVVIVFGERGGMSGDAVTSAVQVLMAYILGQGLSDIRAK